MELAVTIWKESIFSLDVEKFGKVPAAAIPLLIYVFGLFGAAIFGHNLIALICFRALQGFGMPLFIPCTNEISLVITRLGFDVIKSEFPDKMAPTVLGK